MRRLLFVDYQTPSPYNTYLIDGLPPGPLNNPSDDTIDAVLNNERHEFLYFVADGTGGHDFSRTVARAQRQGGAVEPVPARADGHPPRSRGGSRRRRADAAPARRPAGLTSGGLGRPIPGFPLAAPRSPVPSLVRTLASAQLRSDLRNPATGAAGGGRIATTAAAYGFSGRLLAVSLGEALAGRGPLRRGSFGVRARRLRRRRVVRRAHGPPQGQRVADDAARDRAASTTRARLVGIGGYVGLMAVMVALPVGVRVAVTSGARDGRARRRARRRRRRSGRLPSRSRSSGR